MSCRLPRKQADTAFFTSWPGNQAGNTEAHVARHWTHCFRGATLRAHLPSSGTRITAAALRKAVARVSIEMASPLRHGQSVQYLERPEHRNDSARFDDAFEQFFRTRGAFVFKTPGQRHELSRTKLTDDLH